METGGQMGHETAAFAVDHGVAEAFCGDPAPGVAYLAETRLQTY